MNFSANSVSLYKIIVLTQNLIRIIQKTGKMVSFLTTIMLKLYNQTAIKPLSIIF